MQLSRSLLPAALLASLANGAGAFSAGAATTSSVVLQRATTTSMVAAPAPIAVTDEIESDPMFLDEAAALSAQGFALSSEQLIAKTKEFLFYSQGVEKPELLDESFVFMGPFVGGAGGLPKDQFLKTVGGFDIKSAFPDLEPRFHHFRADPLDPGRVWFTSQATGTDSGAGFLGNAPTGKAFSTPPQACSVKLNEQGLVVKYTIGHVMERSMGNTGGLGGIFGPLYAIGKPLPFPEANPWKPSKRYQLLMMVGKFLSFLEARKEAKSEA